MKTGTFYLYANEPPGKNPPPAAVSLLPNAFHLKPFRYQPRLLLFRRRPRNTFYYQFPMRRPIRSFHKK
jgi:hypothetical protein